MLRKGVVFSKMFVLKSMGNELVPSPHRGSSIVFRRSRVISFVGYRWQNLWKPLCIMVCRNFHKICIFLKMGCYLVKVSATYIRGELNFQSDAQIYKETVIIREKN